MGVAALMADPERGEKNVADEDTHFDSSGEAPSLGLFDLWSHELRPLVVYGVSFTGSTEDELELEQELELELELELDELLVGIGVVFCEYMTAEVCSSLRCNVRFIERQRVIFSPCILQTSRYAL
jgi:hypothetical protein